MVSVKYLTQSANLPSIFLLVTVVALWADPAEAADGTWVNTAGDQLWSTGVNWSNSIVANGAGNTADFSALDIAADTAVQTHGGFGYARDYHVERYWREARLMKLAPISQEMILNFVSEHVLGLPRSY